MTQEALKLALEKIATVHAMDYEYQAWAREALREHAMREVQRLGQEIEQEPVAMWDGKYQIEFGNLSAYKHGEHSWIPLYTTPPKRTWVGLTDAEYKELHLQMGPVYYYQEYGQAIEAKLKEKNNA